MVLCVFTKLLSFFSEIEEIILLFLLGFSFSFHDTTSSRDPRQPLKLLTTANLQRCVSYSMLLMSNVPTLSCGCWTFHLHSRCIIYRHSLRASSNMLNTCPAGRSKNVAQHNGHLERLTSLDVCNLRARILFFRICALTIWSFTYSLSCSPAFPKRRNYPSLYTIIIPLLLRPNMLS